MTISGLWHGSMWTFVVWGMWHGIGQVGYKLWDKYRGERKVLPRGLRDVVGWAVTFHCVCLGWVFFAAPSIEDAVVFLGRMMGV